MEWIVTGQPTCRRALGKVLGRVDLGKQHPAWQTERGSCNCSQLQPGLHGTHREAHIVPAICDDYTC